MMSIRSFLFLLAAATLLLNGFVRSQSPKPPQAKPTIYSVVKVGEEVKVVEKSTVSELKKQLASDYKEAVATWTKAKKDAAKAGETFDEPKPSKPAFKVLAATVKTLEQAEAIAAKARGEG